MLITLLTRNPIGRLWYYLKYKIVKFRKRSIFFKLFIILALLLLIYNGTASQFSTSTVETEDLSNVVAFTEANNQIYYYNESSIFLLPGLQSQELVAGANLEEFYIFDNGSRVIFQYPSSISIYGNGILWHSINIAAEKILNYESNLFVLTSSGVLSQISYTRTSFQLTNLYNGIYDIDIYDESMFLAGHSYIYEANLTRGLEFINATISWDTSDESLRVYEQTERITNLHLTSDGDVLMTNGSVVKKVGQDNSLIYSKTFGEPVMGLGDTTMIGIDYDVIRLNNSFTVQYLDQTFLTKTYNASQILEMFILEDRIIVITDEETLRYWVLPGMIDLNYFANAIVVIILINFLANAVKYAMNNRSYRGVVDYYIREVKLFWNAIDILHDKRLDTITSAISEKYNLTEEQLKEELVLDTKIIRYRVNGKLSLWLKEWILRQEIIVLNSPEFIQSISGLKVDHVIIRLDNQLADKYRSSSLNLLNTLKIASLQIMASELDRVDLLDDLNEMTELNLSYCGINNERLKELEEIPNIETLEILNISNNELIDSIVLEGSIIKIGNLYLNDNAITQITINGNLNTEFMDLTNTMIDRQSIQNIIDAVDEELVVHLNVELSEVSTLNTVSHDLIFKQLGTNFEMTVIAKQ